jgi:hypothetical protein
MSLTDISPIKVYDTIVYEDEDHVVVGVSPAGVKVKHTSGSVSVLPKTTEFYKDTANIVPRSARVRTQRTFFAFPVEKKRSKTKNDALGLEMIGKTFFSTNDEPGSLPIHYTVTATGDPRKYMRGKKRLVPILEYAPTAELGNPNAEVHETEVKGVREWFRSTQRHLEAAALGEDIGTEGAEAVLSPLLMMSPIKITRARHCWNESDAGTEEDEAVLSPLIGMTKAKIKLARAGPLTIAEKLRGMISKAGSSRKVKRFKRTAIIQILKGDFRAKHFKHGMDMPNDHGDAHGQHRTDKESAAWLEQEIEDLRKDVFTFAKSSKLKIFERMHRSCSPFRACGYMIPIRKASNRQRTERGSWQMELEIPRGGNTIVMAL